MRLQTNGKVLTALVGSYPKPRYVYPRNGRSLLDSFGFAFDSRRRELGPIEFSRRLDRAALQAIEDQNRAGIDIITDGEMRRESYSNRFADELVDRQLRPRAAPKDEAIAPGAMLLRGHGVNVADKDVRRVCVMILWMEEAANYQLRAMSAGKPRYFTPEELEVIYPQVSHEEVSNRAWEYFSSRLQKD